MVMENELLTCRKQKTDTHFMTTIMGACRKTVLALAMVPWLCAVPGAWAANVGAAPDRDPDVHLLFYAASMADARLWGDIFLDQAPEPVDSWLVKLAPGLTLDKWADERLHWELEGQLVRHFGIQSHWEVNGAFVARWTRFPWDKWVNTSLAAGEGLSWASTRPPLEQDNGGETRSLLNYLLFEVTVAPPGRRDFEFVGRIHHRSGVFGLFGVSGGSNAVGLGVRWRY